MSAPAARIVAVYQLKGGVGKTATAVNLAGLAAGAGARTLLCDLDPQGSASFYFRVRARRRYDVGTLLAGGRALRRSVRGSDQDGLDLLPADLSLRHLDVRLHLGKSRRKVLGRRLRNLGRDYDLLLIDSPPGITLLSEGIFRAADHLLVPVIPTVLSAEAYGKLRAFFREEGLGWDRLLPFFSMVEQRKAMHREMMRTLRARYPEFLAGTIPYSVDVENMGTRRRPVEAFRPRSRAAAAYRRLWSEVRDRLGIAVSGRG